MRPLPAISFLLATFSPFGLAKKTSNILVETAGDTAALPGWHLQSALRPSNDLKALSKPGVNVSSWHRIGSRGTAMAGLLQSGVYTDTDLFYSDHLQHKVDRSVFDSPWLYREEFTIQDKPGGNHFLLKTNGITSKADIYLNGELIAPSSLQAGAYGGHTYDVTQQLHTGVNALLIEAYPTDYNRDLAIGFIDWAPHPPDNGTGVWRDIELSQTGPVSISPPRIVTDMTNPEAKSVHITVKTDVANHKAKHVRGTIKGVIEAENGSQRCWLSQPFKLGPSEQKTVETTVELKDPKIWWPASWGAQYLYTVQLAAILDRGSLSDKADLLHFGIRHVTSRINSHNDIEFQVNGHPFLVLGAGYSSDLFCRFDRDRVKKMFQYVLDMGLNTVRLEGKHEQPELYDLADRMGLMVMAGWECCDKWEAWKYNTDVDAVLWQDSDLQIGNASILHETQMMQTHPSMLAFLVGSDYWPNDRATKIYVEGLHNMDWRSPIVASASMRGYPKLLGPSGMKMEGPYNWVPPNYWYTDQLGAAFGFGSEQGPGVGTPELHSLKKFLSEQDLKDLWTEPHKGLYHMFVNGSPLHNRRIYNDALFARYGQPSSLEEYLSRAQMMDYEATRAEFEGFSARQNDIWPATGVIYWMLNGAWPNLHWQLFDYYLSPAGSYFGTKVGARTEHVAYNYRERRVYLINHSLGNVGRRSVDISLVDLNGNPLSHQQVTVDTVPNSSKQVIAVSGVAKIQDVAFLRLILKDQRVGVVLSRNVYWLSTHEDEMDWDESTWYHTPVTKYADYRALNGLSPAEVQGAMHRLPSGVLGQTRMRVLLENRSTVPAFFLRLTVLNKRSREEIAPVYWSDNYVTLMPKEKIELTVGFEGALRNRRVEISGRNVATVTMNG